MSETGDARQRGLEMMRRVYGWDIGDAGSPDEFLGLTVDHLFGEIWTREGLSLRDRRLLLVGLLTGLGIDDLLKLQLSSALDNGELNTEELREIVVFLAYYAGWPRAAKLNNDVEQLISKLSRS